MNDSKINFENVVDLLNLVENTPVNLDNSDLDSTQSSPGKLLRSKASKVVDDGYDACKTLFKRIINKQSDEKVEKESVPSVINCLVKILSGMYKTLSDQGKQIKEIFEQLANEKNKQREAFRANTAKI